MNTNVIASLFGRYPECKEQMSEISNMDHRLDVNFRISHTPTHTLTHTPSHTHPHTASHIHPHTHTLTHTPSYTPSHTLTHTPSHTHPHILTHTPHTHPLSLSRTHTHSHTHLTCEFKSRWMKEVYFGTGLSGGQVHPHLLALRPGLVKVHRRHTKQHTFPRPVTHKILQSCRQRKNNMVERYQSMSLIGYFLLSTSCCIVHTRLSCVKLVADWLRHWTRDLGSWGSIAIRPSCNQALNLHRLWPPSSDGMKIGAVWMATAPDSELHSHHGNESVKEWVPITECKWGKVLWTWRNIWIWNVYLHKSALTLSILGVCYYLHNVSIPGSDRSCTRGMVHNKIHLINPCCPGPSIALQVQNRGLKQHHSFILYPWLIPANWISYITYSFPEPRSIYSCSFIKALWLVWLVCLDLAR